MPIPGIGESDEDNRNHMHLSWNEIRARDASFARMWADAGYEKGETRGSNEGPPTSGSALCDTPHPGFRAVLHIGTVLTGGGDPNRRRLPLSVAGHPLPPALLSRTWTKGRCTTA